MIILLFNKSISSIVNKLCLTFCNHGFQHARLLCHSLSPRVCSNSCPLSQLCYLTISFSTVPFSFCLQSFLASESFPVTWLFASGGQSIGASASASASVLAVNVQGWFPLGLTGLISLPSKGLSKVFSNTTIQKHQFFGSQFSLWPDSHICTWRLEKTYWTLSNLGDLSPNVVSLLPIHTVHGVLAARILEWFAIPSSRGPHFIRTLHYNPSVLGGSAQHRS